MRRGDDRLLEDMATAVHGAAASLNLLGLVFNLRKRNWFDVAIHLAAGAYHARAAVHHHDLATREDDEHVPLFI